MLEQDQDPAGAVRIPSGTTWDLPRYFNKLISRSCVSLGDSRQVNATLTTNRGRRKCSTAVGWGSASCLNCGRSDVVQQINANKSCHAGLKNHQSSLVTLLNLAVDSCGYETIYQLVDRSLLLTEDDVNHAATTVSLAQKYVDEPAYLGSEESDEESPSREVIVSFQWWSFVNHNQQPQQFWTVINILAVNRPELRWTNIEIMWNNKNKVIYVIILELHKVSTVRK